MRRTISTREWLGGGNVAVVTLDQCLRNQLRAVLTWLWLKFFRLSSDAIPRVLVLCASMQLGFRLDQCLILSLQVGSSQATATRR